jgi:hypothetical protein
MDVRLPDGTVLQNVPEGTTKAQLTEKLRNNGYDVSKLEAAPQPQATQAPQQPQQAPLTDRLGRQAGLTGRYLIEGAANTVGLVSDPIIGAINGMTGGNNVTASQVGTMAADAMGLPSPENSAERVIGEGSKMLVGTGGLIKGGQALANSGNAVTRGVGDVIKTAPGMQAAGAVGAGTAGGAARESGATPTGQFVAALAGGIAAPSALYTGKKSVDVIRNFLSTPKPQQVDAAITQAGINIGDLSDDVARLVRKDVSNALKNGEQLSPDALRRLADYRALQATPTKGSLTLNPADVTRDRNLAKMGANSNDPAAQQLANVQNENNQKLIGTLNTMGAETADDAYATGAKVIGSLEAKDATTRQAIGKLYDKARATDGRSAMIDPRAFTTKANDLLDEKLLGGKLPADVRNKLNSVAKGETPLTVDVAEQLKTNIGALQRASTDPAERLALSQVRTALDDAPLLEGQGQQAIDAFNKARKVNAAYMRMVERTPALKAVREGIEPDKFVNQFIIGNGSKSNIKDVESLRKALSSDPDALQSVRDQMIVFLKNKAINSQADEVANFSPTAYNKALKDIGDMKLSMFFTKGDIEKLKQVGRVASYEKFQPTGSAVNNSNTAATAINAVLDKVANSALLRKVPLGGFVADEAKNISVASGARNSLNAGKALKSTVKPKAEPKALPLSTLLIPGSLASE